MARTPRTPRPPEFAQRPARLDPARDDLAIDAEGRPLPYAPHEVRAIVGKMLDEGDVLAVILRGKDRGTRRAGLRAAQPRAAQRAGDRHARLSPGAERPLMPAANPEVRAAVRRVYQDMTSAQLRLMREAFQLDKANAKRLSTVAFCEARIACIDELLRERDEGP
jgi:hypothetical protein